MRSFSIKTGVYTTACGFARLDSMVQPKPCRRKQRQTTLSQPLLLYFFFFGRSPAEIFHIGIFVSNVPITLRTNSRMIFLREITIENYLSRIRFLSSTGRGNSNRRRIRKTIKADIRLNPYFERTKGRFSTFRLPRIVDSFPLTRFLSTVRLGRPLYEGFIKGKVTKGTFYSSSSTTFVK